MSPAQASDTKMQIIQVSTDLMLEKGWTGFSYQDIADSVGIKKASIHYHFPNKEDLGLAIVAFWREMFAQVNQEAENTHKNIYERLKFINAFMCEHFCDRHICPPGILDADFMNLPESMQIATKEWHSEKIGFFSSWLEEGRLQGSLCFEGDAETQAIVLMSSFQGAMQMERTMQNGSFQRVVDHIFERLKA